MGGSKRKGWKCRSGREASIIMVCRTELRILRGDVQRLLRECLPQPGGNNPCGEFIKWVHLFGGHGFRAP